MEEKIATAFSILKELKKVRDKSEKAGFSFLSYLVQIAMLEAQAIASGEKASTGSEAQTKRTNDA